MPSGDESQPHFTAASRAFFGAVGATNAAHPGAFFFSDSPQIQSRGIATLLTQGRRTSSKQRSLQFSPKQKNLELQSSLRIPTLPKLSKSPGILSSLAVAVRRARVPGLWYEIDLEPLFCLGPCFFGVFCLCESFPSHGFVPVCSSHDSGTRDFGPARRESHDIQVADVNNSNSRWQTWRVKLS